MYCCTVLLCCLWCVFFYFRFVLTTCSALWWKMWPAMCKQLLFFIFMRTIMRLPSSFSPSRPPSLPPSLQIGHHPSQVFVISYTTVRTPISSIHLLPRLRIPSLLYCRPPRFTSSLPFPSLPFLSLISYFLIPCYLVLSSVQCGRQACTKLASRFDGAVWSCDSEQQAADLESIFAPSGSVSRG